MDYSDYKSKEVTPKEHSTAPIIPDKKRKVEEPITETAIKKVKTSTSLTKQPNIHIKPSDGSKPTIPVQNILKAYDRKMNPTVHKKINPKASPEIVKEPDHAAKTQQRDEKVQSIYERTTFYELEGKSYMEVKKQKDGQTINRVYVQEKKLGTGAVGRAYLYVHAADVGEIQSKSKVVKVAKGDYAKDEIKNGAETIKEQHVNPNTGAKLSRVTGLVSKVKIVGNEGETAVLSLYNKGALSRSLGKLPAEEMINATSQLLFGLNHLHTETNKKPGRAHRDIKPENIFHRTHKSGKTEYAIADVDGAHRVENVNPGFTYTPGYLSSKDDNIVFDKIGTWDKLKSRLTGAPLPATFKDYNDIDKEQFNTAHDVYSMGVTLRQLLAGRSHLGYYLTELDLIGPLKLKDLPIDKKNMTPAQKEQLKGICDLINKMTVSNWRNRITADEALRELESLGVKIPKYPA